MYNGNVQCLLERPSMIWSDTIHQATSHGRSTAQRPVQAVTYAPIHVSCIEALKALIQWHPTLTAQQLLTIITILYIFLFWCITLEVATVTD